MKNILIVFCTFLLLVYGYNSNAQVSSYEVYFYSDTLNFDIPSKLTSYKKIRKTKEIESFLTELDGQIAPFLTQMKATVEHMKLNDWAVVQLVSKTAKRLYPEKQKNEEIFKTYILNKLGFAARLMFLRNKIEGQIKVREKLIGISFHMSKNGYWIDPDLRESTLDELYVYRSKYLKYSDKKTISLKVENPILFKNKKTKIVDLKILIQDTFQTFEMPIDLNYIKFLDSIPLLDYGFYYTSAPPSSNYFNSLTNLLKAELGDVPLEEKVRRLLTVSRINKKHTPDELFFGREKPYYLEEYFYYETNDCEDRSLFLFFLIKEVLDLPIILLGYSEHANIAVALPSEYNATIEYEGKKYTVLEPSDIYDNSDLGFPSNNNRYKVIHVYHPNKGD